MLYCPNNFYTSPQICACAHVHICARTYMRTRHIWRIKMKQNFGQIYGELLDQQNKLKIQLANSKRLNAFYGFRTPEEQREIEEQYKKAETAIVEQLQGMDEAIKKMSPLQQNIFYLKYRDLKSLSEISEVLGYHVSTIKKNHATLIKKISL